MNDRRFAMELQKLAKRIMAEDEIKDAPAEPKEPTASRRNRLSEETLDEPEKPKASDRLASQLKKLAKAILADEEAEEPTARRRSVSKDDDLDPDSVPWRKTSADDEDSEEEIPAGEGNDSDDSIDEEAEFNALGEDDYSAEPSYAPAVESVPSDSGCDSNVCVKITSPDVCVDIDNSATAKVAKRLAALARVIEADIKKKVR